MFTVVLHLRNTCTIQAPVYYEQFSWFQSPHGTRSRLGFYNTNNSVCNGDTWLCHFGDRKGVLTVLVIQLIS